jgi:hypothetical protein
MLTLDTLEIEILIPTREVLSGLLKKTRSYLVSGTTCQAWGIDHTTPIVVKVSINDKFYLNAMSTPVVECYQRDLKGARKSFRIGEQLKGLLAAFVRYHWPS